MAIKIAQTKTGTSTLASTVITWNGNTVTGNTIVVAVATNLSTDVSGITDSQGNTYVNAFVANGTGIEAELWIAKNILGGATPTVTIAYTSAPTASAIMQEYSGIDTVTILDQIKTNTGNSNSLDSLSTTKTNQNLELLIGVGAAISATFTAGGSFVNLTQQANATIDIAIEDLFVTSTGTYNATFGASGSIQWACGIASFRATPQGTTTSTSSTSSTSSSISSTSSSTSSTSTSVSTTSISTSSTSSSISTSSTSSSISTTSSSTSSTSVSSTSSSTSLSSTSSSISSTSTSSTSISTTSQSTSISSTSSSFSSTSSSISSTSNSTSSTSFSSTSSSSSTSTTAIPLNLNYSYVSRVTSALFLSGISGTYASAPDSAAVSITGDQDHRILFLPNTENPASTQALESHRGAAGNVSYSFQIINGQFGQVAYSLDGTAVLTATSNDNLPGQYAGQWFWLRWTRRKSDGRFQFWTASGSVLNPVTSDWVQVGTDVIASAGSALFDSSASLEIGSYAAGVTAPFAGKIKRVQIRNNILDDGTGIQFDAIFADQAPGTVSFIESSTNVAQVVLYGAATILGTSLVFPELPVTGALLPNAFTSVQYGDVSNDDGDYFIEYGSMYVIRQYKKQWVNNTDNIYFVWKGRSTQSTLVSPILIQIYNVNSSKWETLATANKILADTDFQVSVSQTTSLSNYYDSSNIVTFRSYQLVV